MTDPAPILALVNARVWTNDPRRPWADALLVREGRLAVVGSSAEVRKRAESGALVIDAKGGLVLPAHLPARTAEAFAALRRQPRDESSPMLRAGLPAEFVVLDRDLSAVGLTGEATDARVVLAMEEGIVSGPAVQS